MTISSTIRKAGPFIGNGSTTSFPFAFKIFETSDLLVVLLDEATNTETTLVLNSNYTATMNGDQNGNPGGTVTLIAGALASGYTLTITSDLANLQPTDLTNQGGFYPDVINDALDRSTVQIQQLQEQTDRSLKIAVSSIANVTLPPESANQLLGWDATGQNLANIDPGTLATIVAYATAYADTFTGDGTTVNWVLSHDPAVLYNLDVSINGVTQVPTVDYTLTGTTFTTTTAAPTGAVILVKYSQALPNMSADSQDVRYLPPFTGSTSTTVEAKLAQTVSVKDFGAVGDGVTDDTAAIQAAINAANNESIVCFPAGIYKITGTLEMPLKLSGNFTIDGDIKWSYKKEILQEGQVYSTGTITLDSVWYSKFNHIECLGDVTICSSNVSWGTFWNDFGMIRCDGTLIIDVDQGQSVNQNNYYSCKTSGGVHIKGTSSSGIREAHNNMFFSVDTTGANLTATDGTTGCHLLNDSVLNQTNTVLNWYAEASGSRLAYGNWNIVGDNVDSSSPAFKGGRYNYRLGARAQGRQSSYLPIPVTNASIGGDWGILTGSGFPSQMTGAGAVALVSLASVSTSASNSPDQSTKGIKCTGAVTFSNISIQYQLTTSDRVAATAYVYQEGNPELYVEVLDGSGTLVSAGGGQLTPIGSGWYLLRIGSDGGIIDVSAGKTIGTIRIFSTTGVAKTSADFRIITSFFVTTEAIAPIPSIKYGQTIGYSTAAPTGGIWNRGDICWNTTPSASGTPGWVCVTAGTPGTWKAMANLAA